MTDQLKSTDRTEAQREASRRNGALSQGPITPEGKAISSGNRLRHNVLASTVLLEGESRVTFNDAVESLEVIFRPQDPYESSLVQMMAVASWRHTRLLEMERAAIAYQKLSSEEANLDPATRAYLAYKSANSDRSIHMFNRQAARLDRQYHQAAKTLNEYRRTRDQK